MAESVARQSSEATGAPKARRLRRKRVGVVVRDAHDKTIRVEFNRMVKHPKYGKYRNRRTTVHAHDEQNQCKAGDMVEIMMCRPISKTKSWRLLRIVRSAAEG